MPLWKKPISLELEKMSLGLWHWKVELWHRKTKTLSLFRSSTFVGFLFIKACTQPKVHTKLSFNRNSCRECEAHAYLKKILSHCVEKNCLVLLIILKIMSLRDLVLLNSVRSPWAFLICWVQELLVSSLSGLYLEWWMLNCCLLFFYGPWK